MIDDHLSWCKNIDEICKKQAVDDRMQLNALKRPETTTLEITHT